MDRPVKYEFETFDAGPRIAGRSPQVTISKFGNLVFNRAFKDAYWSELEGRFVIFQYDAKNEVIGLRIISERTPNSRPVRVLQGGKGLTISARAFLKHYKVHYEKESRSYPIETHRPDGQVGAFFIINLKKEN